MADLLKKCVATSGNPSFSKEENKLIYTYDSETLWIEPWGADSFRVRATRLAEMPLRNWEMTEVPGTAEIFFYDDGSAEIRNGKIRAEVTSFGKISFYNQNDKLILKEYVRNNRDPLHPSCLHVDGRTFRPTPGSDAYHLTARFESLDPNEKIYGMGQYQEAFLNLKGMNLELAHRNSQASVPFMISSLGYGFFWNNPAVGRVSFAKNVTEWEAGSTDILDYWVTAGDTPAEIEEAYASVTGTVPMMPDYGMGFWQCKLRYRTQEELLNAARGYKRRGLPISVIVVDFFHWPFQGDWKFDPRYFPDPDAMIAELKEMGIELMVSIWPTVDTRCEHYWDMMKKGYLVRTDRGIRYQMDCYGDTVFYDATNPKARDYVWNIAKQNYYDKGVKIFWLDEAEPEYNVYDFDNYRYHIGSNAQFGNIYPVMFAKTFFDGMKKDGMENIVNLVRCAWAGSQKYGALVWSGDIRSDFEIMQKQYVAGLNMGLAGIPWWTTDIGGFEGGDIYDPAFHELLVRWFEYGTFCPVMRLHGNRTPVKPRLGLRTDGECGSGADNEVWSYGPEVEEICTKYLRLRERMKPYITTLMQAAHEKGTPVMRTLFYEFPDDPECWDDHQEYLFGSDLLVAPVMYAKMTSRAVYLPKGACWTDVWTGKTYEGGQTVTVDTPLDQIPLFSKNDFAFPLNAEH